MQIIVLKCKYDYLDKPNANVHKERHSAQHFLMGWPEIHQCLLFGNKPHIYQWFATVILKRKDVFLYLLIYLFCVTTMDHSSVSVFGLFPFLSQAI